MSLRRMKSLSEGVEEEMMDSPEIHKVPDNINSFMLMT